MAEKTSNQEAAPPQGQGDRAAGAGGITKIEAVRQALAELGKDASLARLQGHIRDRLRIEMTTNHISDARGKILRKEAGKGKAVRKPPDRKEGAKEAPGESQARKPAAKKPQARKPAAQETVPQPPLRSEPAPAGNGPAGGIPLRDILAVKDLVGRLGAEPLRVLIDAFSK